MKMVEQQHRVGTVALSYAQGTADHTPVTSVKELATKYGSESIPLVVREVLARTPGFPGDEGFAQVLGEMMADLSFAIRAFQREEKEKGQ